jgi:hypothetical protein
MSATRRVWHSVVVRPPTWVGPHPLPAVPCGVYEADEPGGSTVPIRVRRRSDRSRFAPGRWVMEWPLGADGVTREAFAYVNPDGLEVFGRFRKSDYAEVGTRLFAHFRGGECFDGWEFRLVEPRCARCGKKLKPGQDGLHPECLKEWGHA